MPPWDMGQGAVGSLAADGKGGPVLTARLASWGGGIDFGNHVVVDGNRNVVEVKYGLLPKGTGPPTMKL